MTTPLPETTFGAGNTRLSGEGSLSDSGAKSALILGASSGFGEAAALEFARAGYDIFGVHLDRRAGLARVEQILAAIEAEGVQANEGTAVSPVRRACPDCGLPLRREAGCYVCSCGYSKCG